MEAIESYGYHCGTAHELTPQRAAKEDPPNPRHHTCDKDAQTALSRPEPEF